MQEKHTHSTTAASESAKTARSCKKTARSETKTKNRSDQSMDLKNKKSINITVFAGVQVEYFPNILRSQSLRIILYA